ncbi:hypothetical protein VT84_03330 [Gemmata sp. SH-PL17]|uniref:phage tail assembly protein T n=1 Tax=Gemmata sp. SH-PL17 TaxID=1630693 RepID=UPI00078D22AC|nr:hypothetical protein [Gemmata sp. SH-PL17]AMV23415.1 hypothetical protein VT84_03330 [Gemmata sp. SH-PL17]
MFDLSAAELDIWRQWYEERGFPDDRAEWGRAIGASYTGAVWGGKAKPAELIPRTRQRQVDDVAGVKAWFEQFSNTGA